MNHILAVIKLLPLPIALLFSPPTWAHGDEDHSHAAEPAPVAIESSLPRTSAKSEEFELVAVLDDNRLTLFLDHYASNAPVVDARIEVESGAWKQVARQYEPGVYGLPAAALAKPGKYPLVFSIETEASADLLTATLEVAPPAAVAAQPADRANIPRVYWFGAGTLLLAGVWIVLMRRRR